MSARGRLESFDLDEVLEGVLGVVLALGWVALILGGVTFYLGGAAYGAYLLGGWAGAFALAVFGIPPMAYALVKSNQRKSEQTFRADFRHRPETTVGDRPGVRTVD